ncbi:hypothetical protein V1506DRAFT_549950 [Lipomyces tetrasporus]
MQMFSSTHSAVTERARADVFRAEASALMVCFLDMLLWRRMESPAIAQLAGWGVKQALINRGWPLVPSDVLNFSLGSVNLRRYPAYNREPLLLSGLLVESLYGAGTAKAHNSCLLAYNFAAFQSHLHLPSLIDGIIRDVYVSESSKAFKLAISSSRAVLLDSVDCHDREALLKKLRESWVDFQEQTLPIHFVCSELVKSLPSSAERYGATPSSTWPKLLKNIALAVQGNELVTHLASSLLKANVTVLPSFRNDAVSLTLFGEASGQYLGPKFNHRFGAQIPFNVPVTTVPTDLWNGVDTLVKRIKDADTAPEFLFEGIERVKTFVKTLDLSTNPAIQACILFTYVLSIPIHLPMKSMRHHGQLWDNVKSGNSDRRPWRAVVFIKLLMIYLKDRPYSVFTPDEARQSFTTFTNHTKAYHISLVLLGCMRFVYVDGSGRYDSVSISESMAKVDVIQAYSAIKDGDPEYIIQVFNEHPTMQEETRRKLVGPK